MLLAGPEVRARVQPIRIEVLSTADIRTLWDAGEFRNWTEDTWPVPTIADIANYGEVSGRTLTWFLCCNGDTRVALIPFEAEKRSFHRIQARSLSNAGYSFFDYLPFWCVPQWRTLVLDALVGMAKGDGVDIISFGNLLISEADLFPPFLESGSTQLFDVSHARKAWRDIYSKKSLLQAYTKVRRDFDYRVENFSGDFDDSLLDEISVVHAERWGFDGIQSPLSEPQRRAVYTANRPLSVLTVLWVGREILAAHYGLRFRRTIIFHTPVVNVKYLDCSPLQLLLLEVAKFCENSDIEKLDFGIGAETYKLRYANGGRRVFGFLLPVTWRGRVIALMQRLSEAWHKSPLSTHLPAALRNTRKWTARLGGGARYYIKDDGRAGERVAGSLVDPRFLEIGDYASFVDFARNHELALKRTQYEHFRKGSQYICWIDNDRILIHGWVRSMGNYCIDETGDTLVLGQCELLHDLGFPTGTQMPPIGRAFIESLLSAHPGRLLLTYSLSNASGGVDLASEAGFERVSRRRLRELNILD